MSDNDNQSFNDIPLNINELDVSNFINLLDQYLSDIDWIQQALNRLILELQEEIDLNIKLKELQPDETGFLVNKVQDFINKYQTELINTENELQQILIQLQQLITENENLMNSNNALKEKLIQLNTSGIDVKITNIRTLINNNIKLLMFQYHSRLRIREYQYHITCVFAVCVAKDLGLDIDFETAMHILHTT